MYQKMATGTNAIANEGEAKTKGGSTVAVTSNKGCTKTRAIELNCTVAGNYANNQLVKYSSLGKNVVVTHYPLTFSVSSNPDKFKCVVTYGNTSTTLIGASTPPSINIPINQSVTVTIQGSDVITMNPNKKVTYIAAQKQLNGTAFNEDSTTFIITKATVVSVTSVTTTTKYSVYIFPPSISDPSAYFKAVGSDNTNWVIPDGTVTYSGSVGLGYKLSGYTREDYGAQQLSYINTTSGTFIMPDTSVKLTPDVTYINYTLSQSWDPTAKIALYCNNTTFKSSSYTFHYNDSLKFTSETNTVTNNGVKTIGTISKISVTNNSTGNNTEYTLPCTITGPAANLDIDSGSITTLTQYQVTLFPLSGVTISTTNHASGSYVSSGTNIVFTFILASGYINPKVTAKTLVGKLVAVNVTISPTGGTASFTMPSSAVNVTITATASQDYITSFSIDEGEGVDPNTKLKLTVDGVTSTLTKTNNTLSIYNGKSVTAQILPVTKEYTTRPYRQVTYRMQDWQIDLGSNILYGGQIVNDYIDTLSFTMPTSNVSISALNQTAYQTKYIISKTLNSNCGINLSIAQSYVLPGTSITVNFVPASGYIITNWTIEKYGQTPITGTSSSYTFTMPSTDINISVAVEEEIPAINDAISILSINNSTAYRRFETSYLRTVSDTQEISTGLNDELTRCDNLVIPDMYKTIGSEESELGNQYAIPINSSNINIIFIIQQESNIESIGVIPCCWNGTHYEELDDNLCNIIVGDLNNYQTKTIQDTTSISNVTETLTITCLQKFHRYLITYTFYITDENFIQNCITDTSNSSLIQYLCSRLRIIVNNNSGHDPTHSIDFNYTCSDPDNWYFTAQPRILAGTNIDEGSFNFARSIVGLYDDYTNNYLVLNTNDFVTLDLNTQYLPAGNIEYNTPIFQVEFLNNQQPDDLGFYVRFDGMLQDMIDPSQCYITLIPYSSLTGSEGSKITELHLNLSNQQLLITTPVIDMMPINDFLDYAIQDNTIISVNITNTDTYAFTFRYNISELLRQNINNDVVDLLDYSSNVGIYFSLTYAGQCFSFVTKLPSSNFDIDPDTGELNSLNNLLISNLNSNTIENSNWIGQGVISPTLTISGNEIFDNILNIN